MNPFMINVFETFMYGLGNTSESHHWQKRKLIRKLISLAVTSYFVAIHHLLKVYCVEFIAKESKKIY